MDIHKLFGMIALTLITSFMVTSAIYYLKLVSPIVENFVIIIGVFGIIGMVIIWIMGMIFLWGDE